MYKFTNSSNAIYLEMSTSCTCTVSHDRSLLLRSYTHRRRPYFHIEVIAYGQTTNMTHECMIVRDHTHPTTGQLPSTTIIICSASASRTPCLACWHRNAEKKAMSLPVPAETRQYPLSLSFSVLLLIRQQPLPRRTPIQGLSFSPGHLRAVDRSYYSYTWPPAVSCCSREDHACRGGHVNAPCILYQ